MSMPRRDFLVRAGQIAAALTLGRRASADTAADATAAPDGIRITGLRMDQGVEIETDGGITGRCAGSQMQNLGALRDKLPAIRSALIGRNALDMAVDGELLWELLYPGKARLFSEFRDPFTGALMLNKARPARHTQTGRVFIALSTIDNALWDLRGRLMKKPAYQILGPAQRHHVPVYWRPGEVGIDPAIAARKASEAFSRGYRTQKWYFNKGTEDGEAGFKENVELVRKLREALPDATLMFDNHTIRFSDDVDYSLRLCKAVAQYRPYWIEEPICPEHLDGYARIKGETGLTIAGGEHWYTRWAVKPFLDRKCIDIVNSDPFWCGGLSEWLKVCQLVSGYPGVRVVPHATYPWMAAPHGVASQPEELCPLVEYNAEQSRKTMDAMMAPREDGAMTMAMPDKPGLF